MLKLVVLGAGNHSRQYHLPALARYVNDHPGEVELAALCDLDESLAATMAAQFGFKQIYTNLDEMLRVEKPDGCIAITPISVMAEICARVVHAKIPLLMEKPPGATANEARAIVDLVQKADARVMVSVNRRFDPACVSCWTGGRIVRLG
ncbi:MAG: Gfo/Idh/MocA family oxidoreductase [Phycisphaerales bacterium]|nr:Gfo/Idh/MocA family oxidoreductase [Phycisphaerales bacterium]